ncbi:redoxin domain-containing protein [Rubritalea tangerina]|uniref:Redoxin domain-containing protein n=1 Tax=Rubritalea tangerina TaxID=430798 RepID=A0ABW4ZDS5_9BACT
MKRLTLIFGAWLAGNAILTAGSAAGAERIVKEHRLAELEWKQEMLAARSSAQKLAVWEKRPDAEAYGKRMVGEIGNDLNDAWTMPYVVWLLNNHPGLSAQGVAHLIEFTKKSHWNSPQLGGFCLGLTTAGDWDVENASRLQLTSKKLKFIESVVDSNLPKPIRGQACLALSGTLAKMGDSQAINRRRLDLIRKAIINAADTKVGEVTLADLAKEEIYRMTKLSKGSVAPNLKGSDSKMLPMQLSDYRGKVVVLVFWTSWEQPVEVLDYLRKLEQTYAGKPVQIVGVNRDPLTNLRQIEAGGKAVGKNFSDPSGSLFQTYRVTQSPVCYVLDKEGVIQYNGGLGSFVDLTVSAILSSKAQQ